jgi:antitoxin component YwqK of YwqJK toxin-antitoxin module
MYPCGATEKKSMKILSYISITIFFPFLVYSQIADTIYAEGKISSYGFIKNGKRIETWCLDVRGNDCFMTVTYSNENNGCVKIFDNKDSKELVLLNHREAKFGKDIINNQMYLKRITEIIFKTDSTFIADGWQAAYYPNGITFEEGYWKNGLRHGEWTSWYSTGRIANKLYYVNGNLNSNFISYYEDGQIMTEGVYKNGMRINKWKEYYDNGNLKEEGNFSDDINAIWVTENNIDSLRSVYPDELLNTTIVNYFLDFKSGEWKYYNKDKTLIRTEEYFRGKKKE